MKGYRISSTGRAQLFENLKKVSEKAEKGKKIKIESLIKGLVLKPNSKTITAKEASIQEKVKNVFKKTIGELTPEKGLEQLTKALKKIEKSNKDPELVKTFKTVCLALELSPNIKEEFSEKISFAASKFKKTEIDLDSQTLEQARKHLISAALKSLANPIKYPTEQNPFSILQEQLPGSENYLTNLIHEIDSLDFSRLQKKQLKTLLATYFLKTALGHEWGIGTELNIQGKNIATEGLPPATSPGMLYDLASEFDQNKELHQGFSKKERARILEAAKQNSNAAYLESEGRYKESAKIQYQTFEDNGLAMLHAGWSGHGVALTLHKHPNGKVYLYYCNRGAQGHETDKKSIMFESDSNLMSCFEVTHPEKIDLNFFEEIFKNSSSPKKKNIKKAKTFLERQEGMFSLLGLERVPIHISKGLQKIGNCGWANQKGNLHAALIALAFEKKENWEKANNKGSIAFKQCELEGRKKALRSFFDSAVMEIGGISKRKHFKILNLIFEKINTPFKYTKFHDPGNYFKTFKESTLEEIQNFFKHSNFSLEDCTSKNITKAIAEEKIKTARPGYFLITEEEIVYQDDKEKVKTIPLPPKETTLQEFLQDNPKLTFPIFYQAPPGLKIKSWAKTKKKPVKDLLLNGGKVVSQRNYLKFYKPLLKNQPEGACFFINVEIEGKSQLTLVLKTHGKIKAIWAPDNINLPEWKNFEEKDFKTWINKLTGITPELLLHQGSFFPFVGDIKPEKKKKG